MNKKLFALGQDGFDYAKKLIETETKGKTLIPASSDDDLKLGIDGYFLEVEPGTIHGSVDVKNTQKLFVGNITLDKLIFRGRHPSKEGSKADFIFVVDAPKNLFFGFFRTQDWLSKRIINPDAFKAIISDIDNKPVRSFVEDGKGNTLKQAAMFAKKYLLPFVRSEYDIRYDEPAECKDPTLGLAIEKRGGKDTYESITFTQELFENVLFSVKQKLIPQEKQERTMRVTL